MTRGFVVIPIVLMCLAVMAFGFSSIPTPDRPSETAASVSDCSDGWRITGYYTPVETDFIGDATREIEIRGVGTERFSVEFLRTIFDDDQGFGEGWGKTRFGWYLGNYDGGWHKADAALDANDKPLEPDAVAVDNAFIPVGSIVTIPDLPGDLGKLTFHSTDVGVSVHGKHIDVYTGEGRDAGRRMYRFTYEEGDKGLQRVCFSPASD
ncbi:MAG: 3D domain-containing protein [Acidobacteriota bacterium]